MKLDGVTRSEQSNGGRCRTASIPRPTRESRAALQRLSRATGMGRLRSVIAEAVSDYDRDPFVAQIAARVADLARANGTSVSDVVSAIRAELGSSR